MQVFLSGSFRERDKITEWMKKINAIKGMEIIYDWTKHSWEANRRIFAEENLIAIKDCDIFVFDVGEQGSLGKSILLGVAIAYKKEIFVIGKFPEIIFNDLIPDDHKFENFESFYNYIRSI